MAMSQAEIHVIIKAIDEMSAPIREIAASSKQSMKDTQTAVFNASMAWDLLKTGIKIAGDFAKDSIGEYLEGSQKLNLAKANIEATGLSWNTAGIQIEEFGAKMATFGIKSDDAVLSAAKLTKATGDTTTGLNLAKLAADLTTSGFGTLEDNTTNLAAIMIGKGSIAAKTYKLNLSETATTADIVRALQDKATMSVEKFGDTIPGKIAAVTAVFDDLKQAVGEGLVAGFTDATKAMDKADSAMQEMSDSSDGLKIAMYELSSFIAVIINTFGLSVAAGENLSYTLSTLKDLIKGDLMAATNEWKLAHENSIQTFNNLGTSIANLLDPVGNLIKFEDENSKATKKASDENKGWTDNLKNAEDITNKFADAVKDANEQLKKMAREFAQSQEDTVQEGKDNIVDYIAQIQGENAKATQDIANNQSLIKDLIIERTHATSKAEREAIDQHISDLRAETLTLQDEMGPRNYTLKTYYDEYKGFQTEIDERSKYFAADEITRIKMDTQTKLLENQKEYLQKQINLLLELKDKKEAADKEVAIEKEKATIIKKSNAEVTMAAITEFNTQLSALQKFVSKGVSEYKKLQKAATSYASAAASAASQGFSSAYSSQSVDDAIIAPGGKVITTSPQDYLIATKNPASLGGGGGVTFSINIENVNGTDKQAARKLCKEIMSELRLQMAI